MPASGLDPAQVPLSRQLALDSQSRRDYTLPRTWQFGEVAPAAEATELVVETHHLTKIYQNRQIALNDVSLFQK